MRFSETSSLAKDREKNYCTIENCFCLQLGTKDFTKDLICRTINASENRSIFMIVLLSCEMG